MRGVVLIILFFLISVACKSQSKSPIDLGQGKISLTIFWFPDTAKLDTAGHRFLQYTYYLDHNKILKKGHNDSIINKSDSKQITKQNDTVNSHLTVSLIDPTYLIDWEQQLVYTFYNNNHKRQISLDSLKNYSDDCFYRTLLIGLTKKVSVVIDTSDQIKIQVCGINCFEARYKGSFNSNWRSFIYTKEKLSFYSPLSIFFNNSFSYPILSFDSESDNNSYLDHKHHIAITRIIYTNINQDRQLPSLFIIPKDLPMKKNVSKEEMYINITK